MAVSAELGERRTLDLPAGTIEYRERGSGRPVVFVHGVGVNADLWRAVVPTLAVGRCCITPDLPLGAHAHPLREGTDLSLPGLARIVADLLEALELEDVAIVANDTGGAIAQWLVGNHPERIARLVLTSCDAFEKFPPTPQRYLLWAARSRAAMWCVARAVQVRFVQRLPLAYGWATRDAVEPKVMRSYTEPIRRSPGARRDLAALLRAVDTRHTEEAAESLRGFDRPALVVWGAEDKLFPIEHGRRLAELLPDADFVTVPSSRTFIPEDQPERLTGILQGFLSEDEG